MIVVLFVSIYTTRVVLEVLGVEDFGVYNVVCGFVTMFSFLNASMSNGIQRFYNFEVGSSGNVTKVYCASFVIQMLLALTLFVILESIGLWYVNKEMVLAPGSLTAANVVFQCSVISLIFVVIQIPYSAAILAHEKMDYYALVSIIDVFLKLGIVLVLPYIDLNKLAVYGFMQLIVSITNFLLYYVYSKRNFNELVLNLSIDKKIFKSIYSFSGWNVLSMFAWMTQGQGINMLINLFFGPIINAARGVSGQIQSAIQGFCENLVVAFRPQLVQSYSQGDIGRTNNMMYSMSKIMFVMFFLLSTPIIFDIDYILKLWLGSNIPSYTAQFTILILLSMYPRNFVMAFAQVVHATGNLKVFQIITSAVILLVLPISYICLINGADVLAVYCVNLAICVLLFVVCMVYLKKVFPFCIRDYIKQVIFPCVSMGIVSLLIPCLSIFFLPSSFIRLTLNFTIGSMVSIIVAYFIVLNNNERDLIRKMIQKK